MKMTDNTLPLCCLPPHYVALKYIYPNATIPPYVFETCYVQYYEQTNFTTFGIKFGHSTEDDLSIHTKRSLLWFDIILRGVCLLGIIGNLLNLIVLASRRITSRLDDVGKSMNRGLMALAVSDLLFCAAAFPHSYISGNGDILLLRKRNVFVFYNKIYGTSLISVFTMSSIWLVVIMSVARYFGIADPLHARNRFWTRHMTILITVVFIMSILFTLPMVLYKKVSPCQGDKTVLFYLEYVFESAQLQHTLEVFIRWIWPVIASFLPIFILFICNIRLVRELRRLSSSRRIPRTGNEPRQSNSMVTITLVSIVIMSLVLVAPPEFLRYVNPYEKWGAKGLLIANLANLMQTMNFAVNFVLYCVVNVHFRKTIKTLLCSLLVCLKIRSMPSPTNVSTKSRQSSNKSNMTSCRLSDRLDEDQDLLTPQSLARLRQMDVFVGLC